ncbi:hypothetical protein KSP39_PZI024256 [Platanthera zijinensis]|uniref:Protein kinase domain-containing protein n=1 Tax=Platanthera zijinensis TaxID=2320716 RepID=A0AAP0AU18_9ASPA
MAIDENPAPTEFRPLNPNRNPIISPETPFPIISSSTSATADHTSRLVKMLCSFGGRFIPRPSDGTLRYAGGDTRIIFISRWTSFPEFYRKMAGVYGGPVAIRYQIPDEELDALISVSSSEDLDNMMCEYDNLAVVSGDGSARFRIFLFSPSEIASAASEIYTSGRKDIHDRGKTYIEAINGIVTGAIRRKDSIASAASIQKLYVPGDGLTNGGKSPTAHSPRTTTDASHDPSSVSFLGNATSETEYQGFTTNSTVVGRTEMISETPNPPPEAPYASQSFSDIQQAECINPHSLPMAGGHQMVNAGNLSPPHISSPSVPSYLENLNQNQGTVKSSVDENQNSERILQFTPNGNYKDFPLSLSHLPSLHHSNVPPLRELQGFRLEDCQMPQKPLPHANSDTVLIELSNFSGISTSESCPSFPTHHSEDITALQSQHREGKTDVWESVAKPKLESIVNPDQFDVSWMNRNSEEISRKDNFVVPNANKFDHCKSKQSLNPTGLSGDTEKLHENFIDLSQLYHKEKLHRQQNFNVNKYCYLPTTIDFSNAYRNLYGASPNPPQTVHDNSWQQKMVQPANLFNHAMFFQRPGIYSPPMVSMKSSGVFFSTSQLPFAIKEDVIRKQLGQVSSSMENREYQAQPSMNNFAQEIFHDYVKPVDGMMEALHVLDFEKMKLNEKINPAVANLTVSKDMKTEISPLVGEQNHGTRLQNGANPFIGNNVIVCPGIVPERVPVGANNPTFFSNTGFTQNMNPEFSSVVGEKRSTIWPHNCEDILLSRNAFLSSGILPELATKATLTPASVLNHELLSHIFERNMEPSVLRDVKPGISLCPTEYGYGISINKSSDKELKDEAPLVHPKDLNSDMSAFQRGSVPFPFSKSSFIPWHIQQLSMTCSSDSFFCYQDPWGRWPQRPGILGGDESVSKDTFYGNLFQNNKCPDMAVLPEEGALQPPADSLNNSSLLRPFQTSPGSVYLKQDVGELAKQVGESVLKSLTKYPPASSSPASNESSRTFTNWSSIGEGMTSSNSTAVPLVDDIRRLQIIKNVDLQELQELGSGTFGTVFYGKWRGSEVAIKRISDRCFTGKPSEQERMRADFWNEASKLADLHHPNVLAFYGIVLDGPDRTFATVTEYMVNGSLRNALQCSEKLVPFIKRFCFRPMVKMINFSKTN